MAEYYALISRAVGGLTDNTGEKRHALYERARAALAKQLQTSDPPLSEDQIKREQDELENAIRRVEADAAAAQDKTLAAEEPAPSLRDKALREFRESVAEAEGLGGAAADASPSVRATSEHVRSASEAPQPPRPSSHLFEPSKEEPPPPDLMPETEAAAAPPPDADEYYKKAPIDWARILPLVLILVVVGAAAAGLYWKRHAIGNMFASFTPSTSSSSPPPSSTPAQPEASPKIADRIGPSSSQPAPATAPAAAVAQKVVLYDEDASDPQGKRYVGSAIWRTETISPGPGLAPELAVRADVDIPERHIRMTWSLRRNTDKNLPASHTIEIMFTLPPDFDQKGVNTVPGVLMKPSEEARGVPLAGLSVKVTNGYFLIGLSSVDVDVQRNIALLKDRDWFDIPIVYTSGKRAIMALEKGTPGQRAFEEAFRAWGQ
jgi:hypothetical protein